MTPAILQAFAGKHDQEKPASIPAAAILRRHCDELCLVDARLSAARRTIVPP